MLPGSVSKYCLQHSPVPVIVVRPSSKRDKARVKRAQDPNRHGYKDILEKSGPQGGYVFDPSARNSIVVPEEVQPASEDEAAAVAAAIGYRPALEASPLAQIQIARDISSDNTASGFDDLRSPGVVMKSPELQNLDSPEISDISSSEEEEQGGVSTAPEAPSRSEAVAGNTTSIDSLADRLSTATTLAENPDAALARRASDDT